MPPIKPLVPQNMNEMMELLGMMMLSSPTFVDETGYFPWVNIDLVFHELNEGLQALREKLGNELYLKLREMSDRMRIHFEADPENKTVDTLRGREIIEEMIELLRKRAGKS